MFTSVKLLGLEGNFMPYNQLFNSGLVSFTIKLLSHKFTVILIILNLFLFPENKLLHCFSLI
ncbi:MAG: hypothetical protein UR43_C0011G0010 [candidate division TM6 bacterium GW2011_GWF2_33_332]|nr:MAG: hypothetical protein UR43_C0011G0010 [candidate division TM6 bacterium GW2011_GWF2_33_332]